jgi:hypothetical protein
MALVPSSDIQSHVALAPFADGWAAAFRSGAQGLESIVVQAGATSWSTPPAPLGPVDDHPQSDPGPVTHRSPPDRPSELNEPLAARIALRLPTRPPSVFPMALQVRLDGRQVRVRERRVVDQDLGDVAAETLVC